MCINKLGIALDGYGDGAVLLFRGTEMKHYISQWSGRYRYAFDHTTHQSIEDAIKLHEMTGRWDLIRMLLHLKLPKAARNLRSQTIRTTEIRMEETHLTSRKISRRNENEAMMMRRSLVGSARPKNQK